jgi:probable rRNA maturation factor
MELDLLGDLVICAPLIAQEAKQQHKLPAHHWAHITIHGVLHLLGYDHIEEQDAEQMEALEIEILHKLNIANPYLEESTQ